MALGPLMLDLKGYSLDAEERELIRHPAVGGVILFARNIATAEQVRALTDAIRAESGRHLLIAVDQEGGRVQRLREGFSRLPPLRTLGPEADAEAQRRARELGWLMASEVRAVGCDISFAPVLDLDYGTSVVIGDRSFGPDPAQVVPLARAYLNGMRDAGMLGTGKHFPGHGFVAADSHTEVPVDERSAEEIGRCLSVFKALAAELGGIMPAHVIYPALDALPAGFSRYWLQTVLRGQLQFAGCIFSDDLAMAGAHVVGDYHARAHAALDAGCDMVLVCNDRAGAIETLQALPQRIPREQSDRIAALCQRQASVQVASLQQDPRWQRAQALLA
ncbi:beta-N-acetylhexosaminidase [Permianibacter sp. IMCC34836]|uniref:beta-N-acetylhexosaminidase n=1 Tax=Permianibacter fluminis TaxID=2738515 RepID=UPI001551F765|nr:beta-N-acetylhexosaminidase [Permianibacter fluminis]NQD37619.1 beta-N-acetylhexosaminidase [Permianibacter fluminis]